MKTAARLGVIAVILSASAAPLSAQLAYFGVRGGMGVPSGTFSDAYQPTATDGVIRGAKPGTGYGLDAGVSLGPLGFYAGYDHIDFDCETAVCSSSGKYKLEGVSAGVRVGLPLFPIVKPWAKAGVTFNEINGTNTGANATKITTDRTPGYEIGAGLDIPILALFSITPQVRYVGQKLDLKGTYEGEKTNVSYYTFDVGLRVRTPF
ncbi:MAG TPA: outer membrane beta-barrel protein [Gemmatimonadaceae bacterium]|nr:outer membrane beta-barrel protein [Gemmatimonadaceae bacterium]